MRLTKDQAAENRRRIVSRSAELFKTRGIAGVPLAELMKSAGFTHGGFYNHFTSKDDLAAAAIAHTFGEFVAALEAKLDGAANAGAALSGALTDYLTVGHRDAPRGGCPTAALPVDAARQDTVGQGAYADGLEAYVALLSRTPLGDGQVGREKALAILASLVGAMILARAVKDVAPDLSEAFLTATRDHLPVD